MKITVVDAPMGSGKTSFARQMMNEEKNKRFLYVTPYLKVIDKEMLPKVDGMVTPKGRGKNGDGGGKMKDLKNKIIDGYDIATTHNLFERADDELFNLLREQDYVLLLDEVFCVIEDLGIPQSDIKGLLAAGTMKIENSRVIWLDDTYKGRFDDLKYHAQNGNAYTHNGNVLFWTFPSKMFNAFKEVYVFTYLFKGQIQRYYYDFHKIDYEYKGVKRNDNRYELTEYNPLNENRQKYAELINIYEGNLNMNYLPKVKNKTGKKAELSSTWFKKKAKYDKKTLDRLKANLKTYFKNVLKSRADDIIWTCRKDDVKSLKGQGYAKSHTALNLRATNEHQDKHNLAYVYNRYIEPDIYQFFDSAGIDVNQDLLAVSDLIQWMWRSAIRKPIPEPINIYIPSARMRKLLKMYLNNEI